MNEVHYSSNTVEWETPRDFFDKVNAEFLLDADVCATQENRKCEAFWSKEDDSLKQDWTGLRAWMNPPYGSEIAKWVEKAATGGAQIVVALLPARTDTRWFHNYIYLRPNTEIRFLKGRLKFGGHTNSAPFPNMLVIFRKI